VVKSFARRNPNLVFLRRPHRGKGAAVRVGMLIAEGTIVGFSDADLATPLRFLRPMCTFLEEGYDIAIASRALPASKSTSTQSTMRKMLGYGFGWFVKRILIANIYDTQCGLKLFRGDCARSLFRHLSSPGPLFDMELLVLAARKGFGVIEVPVEWRHHPETRLAYTPLSSLKLLADLWRIRQKYGILHPVYVRKLPRR
ncbi:MAG: glycosyltransferase, partial [bacterium]|nr:glycosyltransferase [bacterium]